MAWQARQSITSIRQFERSDLLAVFHSADAIRQAPERVSHAAEPFVLATLFYEPSTRTRLSFEAAMLRLGGKVISTENAAAMSSAVKGETLADTIRIVSGYADIIALRHHEQGSAARAAEVAPVPVLNAGDGAGEHPSQALLDAYLIHGRRGTLDGLTVTFVGDLRYGRTVHSLALLLTHFRHVTVRLVAPHTLMLPDALSQELTQCGVHVEQVSKLTDACRGTDVLYVTRLQTERLPTGVDPEHHRYAVDEAVLDALPANALIMHPLPRVQELPATVDTDPRAAYFEQARGGLFVRMALLLRALGLDS
jgi:aspartate carbamoyltransferase catalytic subunit